MVETREIRVIVASMTAQIEYVEERLRNETDEKKRAHWLGFLSSATYWRNELQKILDKEGEND